MAGAGAGAGVISKVNSPTIKMDSSLALWPWSLATPHSRIIESVAHQDGVHLEKKMGWRRDGGRGTEGKGVLEGELTDKKNIRREHCQAARLERETI